MRKESGKGRERKDEREEKAGKKGIKNAEGKEEVGRRNEGMGKGKRGRGNDGQPG